MKADMEAEMGDSSDPAEAAAQAAWRVRGVRGATTATANTRSAILEATHELLAEMIERNGVAGDDVASAWFTTTADLNAEFPAVVARRDFGWHDSALMCGHEMTVPGALPGCLRILLHVNTPLRQSEIEHVYLRGATVLRPDRVQQNDAESQRQ
jgi:chorismate mutase